VQQEVWQYYYDYGRDMPWRHAEPGGHFDPYKILVSELMLQQTQVSRVVPKYQEFLQAFPSIEALALAPLGEVLTVWSGLGYNRRAKFLHQAAQRLAELPAFPQTISELTQLPGVGPNTAAAVLVYSFNQPLVFIETNVRTVYIHHFFHDQEDVTDKQLLPLIKETIDQQNPREWFWALMDYGSFLKSTQGNVSRQSRHHTKQAPFEGSRRQVRGRVLGLLKEAPQKLTEMQQVIDDERLTSVLNDLVQEGLIQKTRQGYRLPR